MGRRHHVACGAMGWGIADLGGEAPPGAVACLPLPHASISAYEVRASGSVQLCQQLFDWLVTRPRTPEDHGIYPANCLGRSSGNGPWPIRSRQHIGDLSAADFGHGHCLEDLVALGARAYPASLDETRLAVGLEVDDALHGGPLTPKRSQQLHIEIAAAQPTLERTAAHQEPKPPRPVPDLVEVTADDDSTRGGCQVEAFLDLGTG